MAIYGICPNLGQAFCSETRECEKNILSGNCHEFVDILHGMGYLKMKISVAGV